MKHYVRYAVRQTDAPAVYHLGMGLSILAAVLPPDARIWHAGGWLYGNLYTMVLGSSALARKTTALSIGERLLRNVRPEACNPPPASYEGMLASLEVEPHQLIVEREFSRFMSQARNNGHLNPLKMGYMDVYDCAPIGRQLANDVQQIDDPRLSIIGAVAPSLFEQFVEPQDLSGGFLSRFFLCYGERDEYRRPSPPDSAAYQHLQNLLHHRMTSLPDAPAQLPTHAEDAYWSWTRQVDQYARNLPEDQAGVAMRASTFARKVILIMGLDLQADQFPIRDTRASATSQANAMGYTYTLPEMAFEIAKTLAFWHVQTGQSLISGLATTRDMRMRRDVLRAAYRLYTLHGEINEGSLTRMAKQTTRAIRPIIETLQMEGELEHISTDEKGARIFRLRNARNLHPMAAMAGHTQDLTGDPAAVQAASETYEPLTNTTPEGALIVDL